MKSCESSSLVSGPCFLDPLGSVLKLDLFFGVQSEISSECVFCGFAPRTWSERSGAKVKPVPELIHEIQEAFAAYRQSSEPIDSLMMEGLLDPISYPDFLSLVQGLIPLKRKFFPQAKLGVISNSFHIDDQRIREALEMLDRPWMRLDAGHPELHKDFHFEQIINTLRRVRNVVIRSLFFEGEDSNTRSEIIDHWIETIGFIQPKKVHVLTVEDAPSKPRIKKIRAERLHEIAETCQSMTGVRVIVCEGANK